jgi:hypothetical protein
MAGMLKSRGIKATVLGETLGMARGELPLTQETLPSVWVSESDAEAGLKVVEEWIGPGDREAEDGAIAAWHCRYCGEDVEGQFGACWNCGMEREDRPVA